MEASRTGLELEDRIVWSWPWSRGCLALASNTLSSNPLTDSLCSGLCGVWTSPRAAQLFLLIQSVRNAAIKYLETVEAGTVAHDCDPWAAVKADKSFDTLQPLLERVLSVPTTSAPVERIFSQSGLIMKPNRVWLGKKLLCQLVFLKCNINVWPFNFWCNDDVVWHCIDWATIVLSKIQNRIHQVICCFTVVCSLLFLTGEWIDSIDLEKDSRLSGFGLEHSVL